MMKKRIGIDLFNEVSMISNLAYQNGSYYFIGKTGNPATNGYDSNLFTLNADGTARPLTTSGDIRSFYLTEDGIVFPALRKAADKETARKGRPLTVYQLLPFAGGEAVELFRLPYIVEQIIPLEGGKCFFKALYDHNLMDLVDEFDGDWEKALTKRKEDNESCTVLDEMPFWFNGAGFINKKRHVLYYYDGSECKMLTDPYSSVGKLVLSPDKKQLAFTCKVYKTRNPLFEDLCLLNADTLEICKINEAYKCSVRGYAFDGEEHLIAQMNFEQENGMPNFNSSDLCRIALTDGTYEILIPGGAYNYGGAVGSDMKLGSMGVSLMVCDGKVTFGNTDVNDVNLFELDIATKEVRHITQRQGVVCEAIPAENGGFHAMCMRGDDLTEIYTIAADGTEERISHINDAIMDQYEISTPKQISFINGEDDEIFGWVMAPIGCEPGKKYPCILDIHGGPRTTYGSVFFHEMQYWCAQGYAVMFCNPTGSEGRGDEFAAINGHWGTIDYEDIMQFVEEACAAADFIDPDNIGVTGGSYGGFMTNWIIGHTDRFVAAASQRSISNFMSFTNYGDISYPGTDNVVGGETVWSDPEALWDVSPLKYANRCVTPTLFIHSEQDYRCNEPEGIQMMYALMRYNVETRMCLFKGENHELSRSGKPKNRVRRLDEITKWMDKHMKQEDK